jgi:hypothetical protein
MKCREYQMMLVDDRQERIPGQQMRHLARHLKTCRECQAFRNQLNQLRKGLKKARIPKMPAELDRLTRQRCHNELGRSVPINRRGAGIPFLVFGALLALIMVTSILIFPVLGELSGDNSFTPGEIVAVIIVLQNTVMLLLSPLLIRKYRFNSYRTALEIKNG